MLALIALAAGIAVPAVVRGIAAAQERGVVADVQAMLDGLPVRAFGGGQAMSFDASELERRVPDLPAGWQLRSDSPLQYGPDGVAAGGTVRLLAAGRAVAAWRVWPISGRVTREGSAP